MPQLLYLNQKRNVNKNPPYLEKQGGLRGCFLTYRILVDRSTFNKGFDIVIVSVNRS